MFGVNKHHIKIKMLKISENIKKYFAINLFISFSFLVFAPLELYLTNYSNFGFSFETIFFYTLISFLVINLVLVFMDYICRRGTWYKWWKAIIYAVFLAMYIQGNFLRGNYGLMDGTPLDWKKGFSVFYRITNITIWVLILTICVIVFIKKLEIFKVLSVCLVLTQFVTLFVLLLNYQPNAQLSSINDGKFELSDNHNIIVVIADGFDSGLFEKALSDNPMVAGQFDGFTYYKNTVGTSLHTDESIPTILTGNQLGLSNSYKEGLHQAYEESPIYTRLKQNDYRIGIYESVGRFLDESLVGVAENVIDSSVSIKSNSGFYRMFYQLVAFKYMPHELKKLFWMSTSDFEKIKSDDYYTWDNLTFYNDLQKGITVREGDQNSYQFFHIQGPHEPILIDAEVNALEKSIQMADENYEKGQYQQALGTIKIFTTLINELKDAGIYDNTTIIFTADHGWDVRPWPLLLIKHENEFGTLNVSDAPVSMIEDYLPTLEAIMDQDWENPNAIFNLASDIERARPFYVYSIDNAKLRSYSERQSWELHSNDMKNPQSWIWVDLEKQPSPYKLGTKLLFKQGGNVSDYLGIGFSFLGETYSWTNGTTAEILLDLKGNYNNLLMKMAYFTYHGDQQVNVYANDSLVASFVANGEETKEIVIPKECISNTELIVRFELPDASSPKDHGESEDARYLALAIKNFVVQSIN